MLFTLHLPSQGPSEEMPASLPSSHCRLSLRFSPRRMLSACCCLLARLLSLLPAFLLLGGPRQAALVLLWLSGWGQQAPLLTKRAALRCVAKMLQSRLDAWRGIEEAP